MGKFLWSLTPLPGFAWAMPCAEGAPGTAVVQAFPKRPLPFLFYHQCGLGSWSWTGKSPAGLVVGEYMKLTPSPPPYLKIQYHQHHNTKQSTSAASSLFEQVSAERAPFPCTCRPPSRDLYQLFFKISSQTKLFALPVPLRRYAQQCLLTPSPNHTQLSPRTLTPTPAEAVPAISSERPPQPLPRVCLHRRASLPLPLVAPLRPAAASTLAVAARATPVRPPRGPSSLSTRSTARGP